MKFNLKNIFYMGLAAVFMLLVSSCLKTEEEKQYSPEEEKALRSIYMSNLIGEGYDIDTTATGVYYIVKEEGSGEFAKAGDTLTVTYSGYLIDGTLFDTTLGKEDDTYTFILGETSLIQGWNEGMKIMNKGALVQFIIPSELAYKSTGYLAIPPYQSLVFVIELVDIKSPVDN